MSTKTVVCVDATPTFLHAPMFVTVGQQYTVQPCPETGTYLVLNPDPEALHQIRKERGDYILTKITELKRREPLRYLVERFQEV